MIRHTVKLFVVGALILSSCEDKDEEKYVLEFSPASEHDFGRVEVNKSASQKIRILNTDQSSGPFTGNIEILDSPNFTMDFSGVLVLQKNESKEVYLTFIPSASEEYSGKLVVKNDKTFNEFYLSGIGGNPVSFSIEPTSLNFGLVVAGNTKDLDLVFKNSESSGFDLELSLDLPLSDFIIGSQTSFTLSPNTSKTITVRYSPTQNTSSKVMEVSHNSSIRANPAKVQLRGVKDISSDIIALANEGWALFTSKDYANSRKKFQEAIVASFVSSIYDSISNEAKLGRAWATLFAQETSDFATTAYVDFNALKPNSVKLSIKSRNDGWAGLSISGVMVRSQGENSFSSNVVSTAVNLLDNSPIYEFSYNAKINYKDVRYALIQAYFNLSDFSNAADQLDILDPLNAPHSSAPEDLLSAIQALAGQL
tara:strand:+ start:135 stop:1406 length:1272 start_codon:yes stop_codon:yes gene_type:complete